MSESVRLGTQLGWTEFVRTCREIRSDTAKVVLLVGALSFSLLPLSLFSYVFLQARDEISIAIPLTPELRGGAVGFLWLFIAFISASRIAQNEHTPDHIDLLRSTVPDRAIVVGILLAETLRTGAYVAPILGLITIVLAYGFASPLLLVTIPLTVVLLFLSTIAIGAVCGFTAALLVTRVRVIAQYKTILSFVIAIVFFGGIMLNNVTTLFSWAVFGQLPIAWLLDLALLGTPVIVVPSYAVIGTTVSIGLLLGGVLLTTRLATRLWSDVPVDHSKPKSDRSEPHTVASSPDGALHTARQPVPLWTDSIAADRIGTVSLLRIRRNPSLVWFLIFPLFMFSVFLGNIAVTTGIEAALQPLPIIIAIAVPWFLCAATSLNPFGDLGAVRPALLTSGIGGSTYLQGLSLPSRTIGVPVVVIGVVGSGLIAGHPLLTIAAIGGIGLVLILVGNAIAAGVGTVFPRLSATSIAGDREVVPPSMIATVVYTIPIVLCASIAAVTALSSTTVQQGVALLIGTVIPALLEILAIEAASIVAAPAPLFEAAGATITTLSPTSVWVGGYILPLVLLVVCGLIGRRIAIDRIDTAVIE